jgi:nucleotide-binding universal stress UspA family protein
MLTMRTILHPTDFSSRAEYAQRLAWSLARDHGARLVLLHVVTPSLAYGETLTELSAEGRKAEAERALQRLRWPDPRVQVETRVEIGEPAPCIVAVARELQADLIVMGTHGRSGLARLLLGSIAEQVLRKANNPILTVKGPFALAEEAAEAKKAPESAAAAPVVGWNQAVP